MLHIAETTMVEVKFVQCQCDIYTENENLKCTIG